MGSSTNKLLPVYLAVGDDKLKIEAVIKRMNERLKEFGDMSMDRDEFDGTQAMGTEIVSSCEMFPMMSSVRYVLVKNADKLGKENTEALVNYLEQPNETTILMLIAKQIKKNARIYKAISKISTSAVIDCQIPKSKNLIDTISSYARQNGASIDTNASYKLIELIGNDTVALMNEIKKIVLATGKYRITEPDVVANVAQTAEAKP